MKMYKKIDLKIDGITPSIIIPLSGHKEVSDELERLANKKKILIEMRELKEKRSNRANAYYWYLITKLGNILRINKEDLHFQMLKQYGQVDCVAFLKNVDPSKYFKYYELDKENKNYKAYKVYLESSKMDTKEFSVLLEGVVDEAREQGIQTYEDLEIKAMLNEMEKNEIDNTKK